MKVFCSDKDCRNFAKSSAAEAGDWREQASEQFVRSQRRRRQELSSLRKTGALLSLLLVLVLSGVFGRNMVNASAIETEGQKEYKKYYTSILLEEGDSLWSIAREYSRGSGREISDYIREIRQINRLSGDIIHAGNYLTVVYYK